MCGRLNVTDNEGVRLLLAMLGMDTWPSRPPQYNIAPTQALDVVRLQDEPVITRMNWGVTMTVKGKRGQPVTRPVFNARDDKLWSSYLWRFLIPAQRVLVPVTGFYEWKRVNRKLVQAYYITPANADAMFMAGIYRTAVNQQDNQQDGKMNAEIAGKKDKSHARETALPEVSIVTTAANQAMSEIHDRMPLILGTGNEAMAWIQEQDRPSIDALIQPASNDALTFTPVSNYVNKSSNEGPACIKPVAL